MSKRTITNVIRPNVFFILCLVFVALIVMWMSTPPSSTILARTFDSPTSTPPLPTRPSPTPGAPETKPELSKYGHGSWNQVGDRHDVATKALSEILLE